MAQDPGLPDRELNTEDVAALAPPPRKSFARRHWGKLTLLTLFGVPLLALFVWSYAAMTFTYSSGHRAGVLMKLSKKGWICKTWEGELQVAPVPGSLPVTFPFTVRNDRTAAAIGQLIGRQVELTYEEHKGVILSCFGETQYYGVGARPIQQP